MPEVEYQQTLRGAPVALDGKFDARHGGPFFDIKSYAFEPNLRAVFKRRLEKLTGRRISVDGLGNHAPDAIQQYAFGRLKDHAQALNQDEVVHIGQLGWMVRVHPAHQSLII